ncbi:MAG: SRPBCC family protein [Rhodobacteraceae bacterium]|nr:SRPBCC family protein [Paracoccaceae bacterium]
MKFTARADIDAAQAQVFTALCDVGAFERMAMRRGIEVVRGDPGAALAPGARWDVGFSFRGQRRKMAVHLLEMEVPRFLHYDATGKAIEAEVVLQVVAMSPRRTRIDVTLDAGARTLPARVALQALRINRKRHVARFRAAIAELARNVEARANGMA